MLYVIGQIVGKNASYCVIADLKTDDVMAVKGRIENDCQAMAFKEAENLMRFTEKELVTLGANKKKAKKYNKKTILNSSQFLAATDHNLMPPVVVLDARTRVMTQTSSQGVILAEYIDYDSRGTIGYCIALYNTKTLAFDIGSVSVQSLTQLMQKRTQTGARMICNADLTLTEEGLYKIVPAGAGYESLQIIRHNNQNATTQARKIVAKQQKAELNKQKKALGSTTTQMIQNVAETALDLVDDKDIFRSFTDDQVQCLQEYYMDYTRQVFECLKRSSRIDIAPEKLARLDGFRISEDAKWVYEGMLAGRTYGQYKCALGHKLIRAHVAECPDYKDESGNSLRLLFGSTCAADFFQLDSADMPLLKSTERVMVKELNDLTELANNGQLDVGWKRVELFRYIVDKLQKNGKLVDICGEAVAKTIVRFEKLNIPFPKSLTELFMIELRFEKLSSDGYRVALSSYLKRRKIDKEDAVKMPKVNQYKLFEGLYGTELAHKMQTRIPAVTTLFNIILASKIQGEYGWNPYDQSTGFRGMHNKKEQMYYKQYLAEIKCCLGIEEFTPAEMEGFQKLATAFLAVGDTVEPVMQDYKSTGADSYRLIQQVGERVELMKGKVKIDPIRDEIILNAILHGMPGGYGRDRSTLVCCDRLVATGYYGRLNEASRLLTGSLSLLEYRKAKEKYGNLIDYSLKMLISDPEHVKEMVDAFVNVKCEVVATALSVEDEFRIKQSLRLCKNLPLAQIVYEKFGFTQANTEKGKAAIFSILPGSSIQCILKEDNATLGFYQYSVNVTTPQDKEYCSRVDSLQWNSSDYNPIKMEPTIVLNGYKEFLVKDIKIPFTAEWEDELKGADSIAVYLYRGCSGATRDRGIYVGFNIMDERSIKLWCGQKVIDVNYMDLTNEVILSKHSVVDWMTKMMRSGNQEDNRRKRTELYIRGEGRLGELDIKRPEDTELVLRLGHYKFYIGIIEAFVKNKVEANMSLGLMAEGEEKPIRAHISCNYFETGSYYPEIKVNGQGLTLGIHGLNSILYQVSFTKEGFTISSEFGHRDYEWNDKEREIMSTLGGVSRAASTAKKYDIDSQQAYKTGIDKPRSTVPATSRKNPPETWDYENPIHAYIYGHEQVEKGETRYTASIDRIIETGKPYIQWPDDSKKMLAKELESLVSESGADLSMFTLNVPLKVYATCRGHQDYLDDLKTKLDQMSPGDIVGAKNEDLTYSIVETVASGKFNKCSIAQKPHIEKFEQSYDILYPGNTLKKVSCLGNVFDRAPKNKRMSR